MLSFFGSGRSQTCGGVTRRDFLHAGSLVGAGLSLPGYLWAKERGALKKEHDDRAVILIFNLGAPSQLDTFDMKPEAPSEIRGPFKPIATKAPGIQLSEILPKHAQVADKLSLVRSCYHTGAAVHDAGWQMMQTGRLFSGGVETPHAGAVVSYLRGRKSDLPPHVVCGKRPLLSRPDVGHGYETAVDETGHLEPDVQFLDAVFRLLTVFLVLVQLALVFLDDPLALGVDVVC